jgi:MOSC domain-containing protein YiiM
MNASIKAIFTSPEKGKPMNRVGRVRAIKDAGLEGDRYCFEDRDGDEHCQVTLVAEADLREAEDACGVSLSNGEHRRNLVITGIDLEELEGKRFQLGDAVMEYTGQRPPCGYLEALTEPGMANALVGKGGISVRVLTSGWIDEGSAFELLTPMSEKKVG